MIEKTRKILTAIISAIIIIGIIYGFFALIINLFKEPEILTKEEVALYTIDSNLVVDYTSYYYVSDCFENIVEGAKRKMYSELYDIYIKDYKKQISKDEIYAELKEFGVNGVDYSINAIYYINDIYIIEYDIEGQTKTMLMTFNSKASNYEFAIVK